MNYREIITVTALQNVYDVVKLWATGQATKDQEVMKYYAHLVGEGIVGKDV